MTIPEDSRQRRQAPLSTPSGLRREAAHKASRPTRLLPDIFALHIKTKNCHWPMSGPHFPDHHLLLDEQSRQILTVADPLAGRVCKIGDTTIRSIGYIGQLPHVLDNDADFATPLDMLAELRDDNGLFATSMRHLHSLCDETGDLAGASVQKTWIDEAKGRVGFLFKATRHAEGA